MSVHSGVAIRGLRPRVDWTLRRVAEYLKQKVYVICEFFRGS